MDLKKSKAYNWIRLAGISLILSALACGAQRPGSNTLTPTLLILPTELMPPTPTQSIALTDPVSTPGQSVPTAEPTSTPLAGSPGPQTCSNLTGGPDRIEVKTLLLVYNPTSGPAYGSQTLHEIYPWFPTIDALVQDYVNDMVGAGGGAFCIDVVERYDLDELPPTAVEQLVAPDGELLVDNYHWVSPDVYFHNVQHLYGPGETGGFVDLFDNGRSDYISILHDSRFGIPGKIDSQVVNMVWILGPPLSGFWEAAMAGPGAYWVNGGPIEGVHTSRRFVILAHGMDREVGLWLEVTAHMAENVLNRVSQRWPKVWQFGDRGPFNDWQRYQLTEWQNYGDDVVVPGYAQVGTAHYPPNSPRGSNYAFDFTDVAESYADDWLTYPDFTGVKKPVNRETWNTFNGDYHRGFEYWWFSHIPHNPGNHDGVLNNWWRYIYDVNRDPDTLESQ